MPTKVRKAMRKEKTSSAIDVTTMATSQASAQCTQDPMKVGDPGGGNESMHRRRDAEVVEMAKAETNPKQKERKKESPKGRSKVQKAKRARKDIGQERPDMEKVKSLDNRDP